MDDVNAAGAHAKKHGLMLAMQNDPEAAHAFIAEEMGKMFDDANTDGNGHVEANELEAALTQAGFTPDVVAALKGEFTSHPDVQGKVTKDDFIGFGQDMYDHAATMGLSDEEMKKEFENFDPSKVTVGDLADAKAHMQEHDMYGNGL
jgi:Ca2+-binding EF-hand superfamily protein